MLRPLPLLALLFCTAPALAQADFRQAQERFLEQRSARDFGDRTAALDALVGLEDERGLAVLSGDFTRAHKIREDARSAAARLELRLPSRRRVLAQLELRAERDDSLAAAIKKAREDLEYDEQTLAKKRAELALEQDWTAALTVGVARLLESQGRARRKFERSVLEDAEKGPRYEARLANLELLGRCGGPGTALDLHALMVDFEEAREKARVKLPKLEKAAREYERRLQEESERMGGRVGRDSMMLYDKAKREATDLREVMRWRSRLALTAANAASEALAREEPENLSRILSKLDRGLGRGNGTVRQRTCRMLAALETPEARSLLHLRLQGEKDPAVRAALITALAEHGDPKLAPILLDSELNSESWRVRAAACEALARLRSAPAVPALIERLGSEEGRLRGDVREALRSLTGQDFRYNTELWKRWWADHAEGFEPPILEEQDVLDTDGQEPIEGVGVTFFGVATESTRVLFVLDLSGSMNESATPRTGRSRSPGQNTPREGEVTRLTLAKRELIKAISALPEGATFNIVMYAHEAWTWRKNLVEVTPEISAEATSFVEALQAVGGTNFYSALMVAFDQAGMDGSGEWSEPAVDTIYLLSDGEPSVGVSTDPDVILDMVTEHNRGAGLQIHTIAISGDVNTYLMQRLAEMNGGTFVAR